MVNIADLKPFAQTAINAYEPAEDATEAAILEAARAVVDGLCDDRSVAQALADLVAVLSTDDADDLACECETAVINAWRAWGARHS